MIKFEISASAVAWYAAIVATLSAVVSAYNIFRDRAELLIKVMANMKIAPPEPPYDDNTYVVVTVTNCGRRPTTIANVWFEKAKRESKLLLADSVKGGARELTESKSADYLCAQSQLDPSLKYVCVSDSAGRVHRKRLPRQVLKALGNKSRDSKNTEEHT